MLGRPEAFLPVAGPADLAARRAVDALNVFWELVPNPRAPLGDLPVERFDDPLVWIMSAAIAHREVHAPAPTGGERRGVPAALSPALVRQMLEAHPLVAGVSAECISEWVELAHARQYQPGEFLVRQSETAQHYWLMLRGTARSFSAIASGQEVTLQLFGAPCAWGEEQLLHDRAHTENCVAVDRTLVLQLPKSDFLRLISKHPALMMNVLRDAAGRRLVAAEREKAMAFGDVAEQVADVLMSYVRIYGVPVEGGCMIRISLSQTGLAQDLGVALKSVSRAFKALLDTQLLEKRGTRWVITDVERLKQLAPHPGIDWVSGRTLA